ncbi:MAG: hypothetical protein WA731_18640 [Pseudonocardiaceae bacterium]
MSIYGLRLAGCDELSTWGYDASAGSLYAQLTRNGNSDDDGPDIWITPPDFPVVLVPTALAAAIAAATGSELAAVYVAMNGGLDGQTDDMAQALRLPAPDHDPLTTQPEQPWMPGYDDLPPWTTFLINPHGDRHLGFNDDECQFYRIWQHRPPKRSTPVTPSSYALATSTRSSRSA